MLTQTSIIVFSLNSFFKGSNLAQHPSVFFHSSKMPEKIHAAHRKKQYLDGLYYIAVLAPGITLGKVSFWTWVIKEPNQPKVLSVKFRYRNVLNQTCQGYIIYAICRENAAKKTKKTIEQKIQNLKDPFRKDLGSKNIENVQKNSQMLAWSVRLDLYGCSKTSAEPIYHSMILKFYADLVLQRVRLTNNLVETISRTC